MTYEYKCPNCGSTDEIHISVSLLVKLVQEEDEDLFNTEVIDGSHEWDDASLANCTKCNWHGEVYDLQEHDKGESAMSMNAENAHRRWATDEEYVAKGGCCCPACGSDDLEGEGVSIGAGSATQECGCNQCGAEWTDTYRLTGYI